jgi:C4-dicarboxylate-specific signal transduction histidine kinase
MREQLWHREKMAALATMAASVSHEVGNPLAVITGLAGELADQPGVQADTLAESPRQILEQAARIARMMRQIADFATARGEAAEWVDVNALVKAICDFQSFDRRFKSLPIEFQPGDRLPACELVPDHLNEVLLGLLQACAEGGPEQRPFGRLRVSTAQRAGRVVIALACDVRRGGEPAGSIAEVLTDSRFDSLRRRVAGLGAQLSTSMLAVELLLPPTTPD